MTLQEEIIKELGVKPIIDPKEEIRVSVDFLKDYLKKYPFIKSFVLGISGGQDSSLAGRLAQIAIEEMRQETADAYHPYYFAGMALKLAAPAIFKEVPET